MSKVAIGGGPNRLRAVLRVLPVLAIAACASADPVVDSNGPRLRDGSIQFQQSHASSARANELALDVAHGRRRPRDADVQQGFTQMVLDGAMLAEANCADYFRTAGTSQKWLLLLRDLVAAAGTVATGVAAAASAPSSVTAGIGIGTATAFGALDIYQRNFLFGSDNIEAVRTLVERALSAHIDAVLPAPRREPAEPWLAFGDAVVAIMQHQAICSPAAILALTRSAIRNGDIETNSTGGRRVSVSVRPAGRSTTAGTRTNVLRPDRGGSPVPAAETIAPRVTDEIADRRNALFRYVRGLARRTDAAELANSDLRRVATVLGAPAADTVQRQVDVILAFLLATLNRLDGESARRELDAISAKLAAANLNQRF
jgi:hypothetical protein